MIDWFLNMGDGVHRRCKGDLNDRSSSTDAITVTHPSCETLKVVSCT